jgi:c-di-GMP-binding flagellar brake protein YcgR
VSDGSEQRRFKRVSIPLLIQYRFSPFENYATDYSANVSAGGLFIHCDDAPANVATILLRFLPRDGSRVILAQGEVVRATSQGLAVKFLQIDEADQTFLAELIEGTGGAA